jgi:hypothetical protein
MSDPIYDIIKRLSLVEGKTTPVNVKHGLNKQQQGVPQLPALLKPKNISPTLTKKPYQAHPLDGYMVGEQRTSLEEAMQEVEEDMVSRVKGQFRDYLEKLEKEHKLDSHLVNKAKHDLDIGDDKEVDEQEVEEQATWDADVAPPDGEKGTETSNAVATQVANIVDQPTAPLGESPARTYTLEDGTCLQAYGDDESGYEVRHGERRLPTRFPRIDHADMAVKLFQKRRQKQDLSQDYIEEK